MYIEKIYHNKESETPPDFVLFEHGQFHRPVAILSLNQVRQIARSYAETEAAEYEITPWNGESPNYAALGLAIQRHRREFNLSQEQVADKTGISRNYISMIELGKADGLTIEMLLKLSRGLGFEPRYLFSRLMSED